MLLFGGTEGNGATRIGPRAPGQALSAPRLFLSTGDKPRVGDTQPQAAGWGLKAACSFGP